MRLAGTGRSLTEFFGHGGGAAAGARMAGKRQKPEHHRTRGAGADCLPKPMASGHIVLTYDMCRNRSAR